MRTTSTSRSASTSERGRLLLGTLALALVVGGGARANAQPAAVVSGQLRVVERPGESTRDLDEAVVWLEATRRLASFGGAPAAATTPAAASIVMKGREFAPHVQIVRVGASVAFPNADPFSHNVFSNTTLGAFDLGLYRQRATRAAEFDRPGVYPIYCNIHHRMVSFVVAVPTPWAAQPTADGRFALRDVPPGSYVLHAWHERTGEIRQNVEVSPSGVAPVQLTLDARGYASSAHLNKFGLPYTATRADRY